jgi:uncharacterized alpha-E superfamily protein
VLARIAGNCFWLGRYLERAENTARVAAVAQSFGLRPPGELEYQPWQEALKVAGDQALFRTRYDAVSGPLVATFLLVDRENPSSVANALRCCGSNARSARDLLGDGYWESVNQAWIEADRLDAAVLASRGVESIAEWTIDHCRSVRGAGEDLQRDELPNIIIAGSSLERADFLLRLLAVCLPGAVHAWPAEPGSIGHQRLESLLAQAGIHGPFRRLHSRSAGPLEAAQMILCDPASPRSVLCNLVRLEAALGAATGGQCPAQGLVSELRAQVRRMAERPAIDWSALGQIHLGLGGIAATVERDHFRPSPPPAAAQQAVADAVVVQPPGPTQSQGS